MCLPASGNLYQLTMGIKMRLKLQTFFLLLFLFPAYLYSQVPSLFEIQDQPETEWAAKTASDIRRVAIMMNEDLLRSEEHTSELQSRGHLVCRLLLENK